MPGAEPGGQIDRRLLPFHLAASLLGIRMREVRRKADHRGLLADRINQAGNRINICRRKAAKESVVVFDTVSAERCGIADPVFEGRLSGNQFVEVKFWENADARRRHSQRIYQFPAGASNGTGFELHRKSA